MNTVVTSKAEILDKSRTLLREKGCRTVNIRAVAAACNVSVGSIYNYFDSKAELISAIVESVWMEIFPFPASADMFDSTEAYVVWLYKQMESGFKRYPGFFALHSFVFPKEDKMTGKHHMEEIWQHISDGIYAVLKKDGNIRQDAFSSKFTMKDFADILFSLILSAVVRENCEPSSAIEIIRRILY